MRLTVGALTSLALFAACGNSTNNNTNTDGGNPGGCAGGQDKFMDVCLNPPTTPSTRTACGDVNEFCDKTAKPTPSLACVTDGPRMHPATPATVTLTGYVHPFSSGKSNSAVTIQVFKAADLLTSGDPAATTPVVPPITVTFDPAKATDPTLFRACDVDPHVGCVPVTPSACMAPSCNDGLGGRTDDTKFCRTTGGQGVCADRLRWEPRFSIANVPTNTQLVIRTSGANAGADAVWAIMATFNVFLASDDKSCGGNDQATDCLETSGATPRYQLNVSVLSQADYFNIPSAVGLSTGIGPGLGAVAGEIHDCDNVRIGNAQVGVLPAGDRLTYFNGNPYNTLPDPSRTATGTDRLGLFAALNVPPGKVTVEAEGLVDGKPTLIGRFNGLVFKGTVSVFNIGGGKPLQ